MTFAASVAVRCAHALVVTTPRMKTATPQPVMMVQPRWLADEKPPANEPLIRDVTTAPRTATPRAAPVCRLVDAIAAATPACDRGMPEAAELVIGALRM